MFQELEVRARREGEGAFPVPRPPLSYPSCLPTRPQSQREELGYVTFGVGTVTLEDVFLKARLMMGEGGADV